MTKIIHLITSMKRGGRERQLATILYNTDRIKYPSKIVYFNNAENDYINEYNLSGDVIRITSKSFVKRLFELNNLLKKENPDVVFTWGNLESLFVLLLNPFSKFKFINGSVRHGIRSNKISHYFRTLILHLSPNIVANSRAGLKANNLRRGNVLYNGIDKKFIKKLGYEEKLQRRKLTMENDFDKTLLVSVANLVPYKDYFSILSALGQLKKEGVTFNYMVLGDGPMRKEIEDKIGSCNLKEEVRILGNVANVNEYLQMADIFIHSSKGEGCSNAILEAMAAGLPIIASNTGGTAEIVTEDNGILFKYKSSDELISALKKLITDTKTMGNFGENSNQIIREKYTTEQMIKNYYKIIDNLVR